MSAVRRTKSVLIVSASDKIFQYLRDIMPPEEFYPVMRASSAGEAKRTLLSSDADIVVINAPLPDEFGSELSLDLSEGAMCVLLIVKSGLYEDICCKVEDAGVFTLPKPNTKQNIYSALRLLSAMNSRLSDMDKKNRSLREKMTDIRVVNRAKWLLIENLNMSESDAHYYIERKAMDSRVSRREAAESVIRAYDK